MKNDKNACKFLIRIPTYKIQGTKEHVYKAKDIVEKKCREITDERNFNIPNVLDIVVENKEIFDVLQNMNSDQLKMLRIQLQYEAG